MGRDKRLEYAASFESCYFFRLLYYAGTQYPIMGALRYDHHEINTFWGNQSLDQIWLWLGFVTWGSRVSTFYFQFTCFDIDLGSDFIEGFFFSFLFRFLFLFLWPSHKLDLCNTLFFWGIIFNNLILWAINQSYITCLPRLVSLLSVGKYLMSARTHCMETNKQIIVLPWQILFFRKHFCGWNNVK